MTTAATAATEAPPLDDAAVLDAVMAAHVARADAEGLGLTTADHGALAVSIGAAPWPATLAPVLDQPEPLDDIEPDLIALLLAGAVPGDRDALALARLVARRSLVPGHLYVAMGLSRRSDLSAFLRRRFPGTCGRNDGTMRWKRFLYRELCAAEGAILCKSPVCADCADRAECFV